MQNRYDFILGLVKEAGWKLKEYVNTRVETTFKNENPLDQSRRTVAAQHGGTASKLSYHLGVVATASGDGLDDARAGRGSGSVVEKSSSMRARPVVSLQCSQTGNGPVCKGAHPVLVLPVFSGSLEVARRRTAKRSEPSAVGWNHRSVRGGFSGFRSKRPSGPSRSDGLF